MQFFKNKYFVGIIVLLSLLAFIDWILFGRTLVHEFHAVTTAVNKTLNAGKDISTQSASSTVSSESVSSAEQNLIFVPSKASQEQFKNWLNEESKSMLNYNVNAEALTQKYQTLTAKMTKEQFEILAGVAKSNESDANKKVLSAYLMGYAGYDSMQTLAEFASSSYKLSGEVNVHSVAEAEQTRERAMRVIAIDRFAALAQGDQNDQAEKAKQELKKLIQTIRDPYLKNYAQSKLSELSK